MESSSYSDRILKGVPESAKSFEPDPSFTTAATVSSPRAVVVPSCASSTITQSHTVLNMLLFLSNFPPTSKDPRRS